MSNKADTVLNQIKQQAAPDGDIYEAVYTYYDYFQKYLPAERMSLALFDLDRENMRILAQASNTGSEKTDFIVAVSGDLLAVLQSEDMPAIYIINEPATDPVGLNIIRRSGFTDWSLIGMPIRDQSVRYGAIFFTVTGRNRYTDNHAALLSDFYDVHQWLLDAVIRDHENRPGGLLQKETVEDKYEFFRQVTRRLCGHLDMEVGVRHCFQYLSRFFQASMLSVHKHHEEGDTDIIGVGPTQFFNHFDPGMIARGTERLSPAEKTAAPRTVIINRPERDPTLNRTVKTFGADWSAITMYLTHKRVPLGLASLVTEGRDAFSEEQRAQFSMLHDPFYLALSNHIKHREVIRLKNIIEDEKKNLQEELHFARETTIVGGASGLSGVMSSARVVAGRDSPVLLTGETGSGKEIIANFIHQQSSRRNGPLIKVNCGAIPDTLIDSELFGHEKGAFTGADSRSKGRFERADGGTIFLDEVAELPLPAQVRMLRVLQNKIIERVGGTEPISVDIRIIAATHRNLEKMVVAGKFREDLWFRLNVFPIHIPPLRARRSDIPALVNYFIEKKSREMTLQANPSLPAEAMERLISYQWPGNVRELENVIERELILKKGGALTFETIIPRPSDADSQDHSVPDEDVLELDKAFARHIKNVLALTEGKINGPGGAAELLKIKPGTLRHRMDKLGSPMAGKEQSLTDEEKNRPYAGYYYRQPAPIPGDVHSALEAGPMDPSDALAFEKINDLLKPGYHSKENGYCFMPDGSCYVAVLTRMQGVTGDMLDWWFSWHALEDLRYKIWYPGSHAGTGVNDPGRLKNKSLPLRERYWHTTHYPVEDIGIGREKLSIKFLPPEEFGFDTARFAAANVSTAICTRVGSENKKADHTDMCHFVRQVEGGVEMRSRFWIGRKIKVRMFSDLSPVNRIANTRFIRKMVIPRDTPCQMARHCAQEYNNLAQILPDLYREFGDECVY